MTKQEQSKYDHLAEYTTLNHKQIMFCILYDGNASKTARLAGYANPDQAGYRLIRNVQIKEGLKLVRGLDPVSILSPDQILTQWSMIASDPKEHASNRMKALENLARSHAMFTDKSISLSYTKSDRLDSMSDHELRKILDSTVRSLAQSGMITQEQLDHQIGQELTVVDDHDIEEQAEEVGSQGTEIP